MKKVEVEPGIKSEGDNTVRTLQKISGAGEVEGVVDVERFLNRSLSHAVEICGSPARRSL